MMQQHNMRWHGDVLIIRRNGDGCAASYGDGEVTPTEDNYTDRMTSIPKSTSPGPDAYPP